MTFSRLIKYKKDLQKKLDLNIFHKKDRVFKGGFKVFNLSQFFDAFFAEEINSADNKKSFTEIMSRNGFKKSLTEHHGQVAG